MKADRLSCGCMALTQIAHKDRIYPVMYLRMVLRGRLDQERLKRAVNRSASYVPEILYCVDFQKGRFINRNWTADRVICTGAHTDEDIFDWDLSSDVQMKIWIRRGKDSENLVIGMSHIVTDGNGFLQYLYLLCAIYNGEEPGADLKNERDIKAALEKAPKAPFLIKSGRGSEIRGLSGAPDGKAPYCVCRLIGENEFAELSAGAKMLHVSVNDVLMTAYARVLSRLLKEKTVVLPCPADLRRRSGLAGKLTVGNLTGAYRSVPIVVSDGDSFLETLRQVHEELHRQSEKHLCFRGLRLLHFAYGGIPSAFLAGMIRMVYKICPVSYSNIGKIDADRLRFFECNTESCYLTGGYRKEPDFQLTVSTFKNRCTLNSTRIGGAQGKKEAEMILEAVRKELCGFCAADKGCPGNMEKERDKLQGMC